MMNSEYILELISVFHTGQVEPGSCFQKLVGNVPTGVILKDVSMEVHGGEVMAILGSKGSGKRVLLEVTSRRAQGPTRGQILLNNVPMSQHLFQKSCGYVNHKSQLLEGLTVWQTLRYSAQLSLSSSIGSNMKNSRLRQVLADLMLSQLSNRHVESLIPSEYRRLVIGVQLVKDPIVLLMDEPAWGLNPLDTYLVISVLSNLAKKYNRIMMITMEKPRSDIFPFLDRVSYLCMGEVVYTGSTHLMLDYFRSIGFPCPELENPLMYYLCLSTVDRRSRERFVDSNNQIAALVERFKLEGGPFRKYAGPPPELEHSEHKVPLSAYGSTNVFTILCSLWSRLFLLMMPTCKRRLQELFLRLFLLPVYFFMLWCFYYKISDSQKYQHTFLTQGGLLFNCMVGCAFLSAVSSALCFAPHRNRYYQEAREGLYRGPTFFLSYVCFSLPVSFISTLLASAIVYFGLHLTATAEIDWIGWITFGSVLFCITAFVEQQTIALMLLIRSSYTAASVSVTLCIIYLLIASVSLRSLVGLPDWLYYLSHVTVFRYASAFLHEQMFMEGPHHLPINETFNRPCKENINQYGCRYSESTLYLLERFYSYKINKFDYREDLSLWLNFGISFAFFQGMLVLNLILYLIPLPAFIKSKFRE